MNIKCGDQRLCLYSGNINSANKAAGTIYAGIPSYIGNNCIVTYISLKAKANLKDRGHLAYARERTHAYCMTL